MNREIGVLIVLVLAVLLVAVAYSLSSNILEDAEETLMGSDSDERGGLVDQARSETTDTAFENLESGQSIIERQKT